jgi:hypothetical protein
MADDPKTRLDRIGRDLSRTLLHGSRDKDNHKPWTVATGQQIRVDLPASGDMRFQFTAPAQGGGSASIVVPISHDDAAQSQADMDGALGANRSKYLDLKAAEDIPTWIFSQRSYSISKSPPAEDTINVTAPRNLTIVKAPAAALSEVAERDDCFVSLYRYDDAQRVMEAISRSKWHPAVMLRFKLEEVKTVNLPAGEKVYEIKGTSQGERYYLDKLGLLAKFLPGTGTGTTVLPGIESVSLALQQTSSSTPTPVSDWTLVRTNLTREARSGQQSLRISGPPEPLDLPYVAVVNSHDQAERIREQSIASLKLLQMGSITNSGGYFLRVATTVADAGTLVLAVVLKAVEDKDADHKESAWLPPAANALALTPGTVVDSIGFNGLDHITFAPAVPPGHVSFAWTRSVPEAKDTSEKKFGYGTISLVEYSIHDGAGTPIGLPANEGIAISPSQRPHGHSYRRSQPPVIDKSRDTYAQHTGTTAAMQLLAPGQERVLSLMFDEARDGFVNHYYHASQQCYVDGGNRYARIGSETGRQITIAPGFFRDVFGNRFKYSGPEILRRLFYTDRLTSPGEWPGIRFALFPGQQNGKPCLFLECEYRFVPRAGASPNPNEISDYEQRKKTRLHALDEIRIQLYGVDGDVEIKLSATPLVKSDVTLPWKNVDDFLKYAREEQDKAGPADDRSPLSWQEIAIPCEGTVSDLVRFEPKLTVLRAKENYGPSKTDKPERDSLDRQISDQIMSASSPVPLQVKAAQAATLTELRERTSLETEPANETQSEFRLVAVEFDKYFSADFAIRFGFLRDRLNQHELWLIPVSYFPTAQDSPNDWAFATARPLVNTLGTETFTVPDFNERCTSPEKCWQDYSLAETTVIDQDFDGLARTAFRLIEASSSDLGLVTAAENVVAASQLLKARERIGLTLSVFGKNPPAYLVPLHDSGDDLDGEAVARAARDTFLADLNGFYSIDTVLQLPLDKRGDSKDILTFEGKVMATYAQESTPKAPTFSDVLLGAGKSKVTILYDLPPEISNPSDALTAVKLGVQFNHIQLRPEGSTQEDDNPFSQGQWIEVIKAPSLEWKTPGDFIPVATRSFPTKPVMKSTEVLMPWMDPQSREIKIPGPITAATAPLLVHWGWKFCFTLIDLTARDNDSIHVTTSYNVPPSSRSARQLEFIDGWKPVSLLNSLYAIKLLLDSGLLQNQTVKNRLQIAADLAGFLGEQLASTKAVRLLAGDPLKDQFEIDIPNPIPANPIPPSKDEGRAIMKGDFSQKAIMVGWSGNTSQTAATVIAPAEVPGNDARVIGPNAVQNYKAMLNLRRNERFGPGQERDANSSLIYNCPPVVSPLECWAQNIWPMNLTYDAKPGKLLDALNDFFSGILKNADLASVLIEVGASLVWKSGKLDVITPFSIVPNDIPRGDATELATFVNGKYQELVMGSKPGNDVKSALRLWVKISLNSVSEQLKGRILMEVKAIDFPL